MVKVWTYFGVHKIRKRTQLNEWTKKSKSAENVVLSALFGALEGIRIPDLPLRRRTLYPAELLGHICVWSSDIYQTVADATDAQQMAKCLALLGCHLHAACGRCILGWATGAYVAILLNLPLGVKKKTGEKLLILVIFSLQNMWFRL